MMCISEVLTDNSKILLVGVRDINKSELHLKNFNHAEFIGEALCKRRGVGCANYFLVAETMNTTGCFINYSDIKQYNYSIMLGSYDFKNPDYEYFSIRSTEGESASTRLDKLLSMCLSDENRMVLMDELCEMFALDTYMGQADRFGDNILFMKNKITGNVHLAPLFDFQYSLKKGYTTPDLIYECDVCSFRNISDYKLFSTRYPLLYEKLSFYLDTDLSSIVFDCYDERGLFVSDEKLFFYRDFDKSRKELIKKIVN